MKCEITFRKMRSAFLSAKSTNIVYCFVEGLLYVWKESDIPDCHKITRNILDRFIRMRSKLYGLKRREEIAASFSKQSPLNSKSVAMRDSVRNEEVRRSSFISQ